MSSFTIGWEVVLSLAMGVGMGWDDSAPRVSNPATDQARDAYEKLRRAAGRDPESQVKLALWCEQRGLDSERLKHLAAAVLANPNHAAARGLMGLVEFQGRWLASHEVGGLLKVDSDLTRKLADYRQRRDRISDTADDHASLARWCQQNGLNREARAHLLAVIRIEPNRDSAWRQLGYKKHDGVWKSEAQIVDENAELRIQKAADVEWKRTLTRLRDQLKKASQRDEAEIDLAEIRDPRAVPAVWSVFASATEPLQRRAVEILGRIDSPQSTQRLAQIALLGASEESRRAARETLRHRDPRDYAPHLIKQLRELIRYEVRPVSGPGSTGVLYVEGSRFNVRRLYSPPRVPYLPLWPSDQIGRDAQGLAVVQRTYSQSHNVVPRSILTYNAEQMASIQQNPSLLSQLQLPGSPAAPSTALLENLPAALASELSAVAERPAAESDPTRTAFQSDILNRINSAPIRPHSRVVVNQGSTQTMTQTTEIPIGRMVRESYLAAAAAQRQLQIDLELIENHNSRLRTANEYLAMILNTATSQSLPAEADSWRMWWTDQLGYQYRVRSEPERPTLIHNVPLAYQPQARPMSRIDLAVTPGSLSVERISCFAAGTLVHTREGLVPIEGLRIGDLVLTQETRTGSLGYEPILTVYHNPPAPTLKIQLGEEAVLSSTFHRFWKSGEGWVMARDLSPGDFIRTLSGSQAIRSIDAGETQPVYNLEIVDRANFFVGNQGALVHDNSVPSRESCPFDRIENDVIEEK